VVVLKLANNLPALALMYEKRERERGLVSHCGGTISKGVINSSYLVYFLSDQEGLPQSAARGIIRLPLGSGDYGSAILFLRQQMSAHFNFNAVCALQVDRSWTTTTAWNGIKVDP